MNIKVSAAHEFSTPVRSVNDSWAFEIKEGGENYVPACYKSLISKIWRNIVISQLTCWTMSLKTNLVEQSKAAVCFWNIHILAWLPLGKTYYFLETANHFRENSI